MKSKYSKMYTWIFLLLNSSYWTVVGLILKVHNTCTNSIYFITKKYFIHSYLHFSCAHVFTITWIQYAVKFKFNSLDTYHFRQCKEFGQIITKLQVRPIFSRSWQIAGSATGAVSIHGYFWCKGPGPSRCPGTHGRRGPGTPQQRSSSGRSPCHPWEKPVLLPTASGWQ